MHYVMFTPDCQTDEAPRGFYTEFLHPSLHAHRKGLEYISSKMKVAPAENGLRGLGFARTRKHSVVLRITGDDGAKQLIKVNI